jgi:hypothetical protein
MAKCNDPKKDCFLLKAGECMSKLPGYCCFYDIPTPVKEVPKPVKESKVLEMGPEHPMYGWAHQGFESRIAALT